MKPNIVLVTGSRRAGKDTFCDLLSQIQSFHRFAFANYLKSDLNHTCQEMFGREIWELTDEEKEIIRPLLIAYGCVWREVDPLHWVKPVAETIDRSYNEDNLYVVSDCRFTNEITLFKEKYGDAAVAIEIIRTDGPEPTDEEKKNTPLLKPLMDYTIEWQNMEGDIQQLFPYVQKFYNQFLKCSAIDY